MGLMKQGCVTFFENWFDVYFGALGFIMIIARSDNYVVAELWRNCMPNAESDSMNDGWFRSGM
jgi:hypothetical protein